MMKVKLKLDQDDKYMNLSHIIYDPIKSLLVDIFKCFATMELLQVAELHVHLLLILR